MSRGDQLLRQWKLLRALQARGRGQSLQDLAQEFEVSARTIQRDLDLLMELGFPIEYTTDVYGKRYWRLPHNFLQGSPLVLSLTEAICLHLGEHLLVPLAGTPLGEGYRSLLAKIRSLLPAEALRHFAALDTTYHVLAGPRTDYSRHAATIQVLTEAIHEQRTVRIRYRAVWRNAEYTTRCDPYGMVYHDGDLFLLAYSHRARDTRVFKVVRIRSARPTPRRFERPRGFDVAAQFRRSFGIVRGTGEPVEVRVRFTGPAAALVEERIWHETQRLERIALGRTLFETEADDAVVVSFRLADMTELKRWLRGFGDQAEVLRPRWLREEMYRELLAAAQRYAPG